MKDEKSNTKHTFKSGAQSSENKPWYHLVPWSVFSKRLADRYAMGVKEKGYAPFNWERGLSDPEFVLDRANHTMEHMQKALEKFGRGDFSISGDDDIAAVIWGCVFMMAAQEQYELVKALKLIDHGEVPHVAPTPLYDEDIPL